MGEVKGLRAFLGRPLIVRVVERLQQSDCLLVTNTPDAYRFLGLPMIGDDLPGLGPLGGLQAAMTHCTTPLLAAVACDMPFVNVALLTQAREIAMTSSCNAVVPRSRDGLEPLHAVYNAEACLPLVREAIAHGDLSMMKLLAQMNVREIDCREDVLTFTNVNTADEFHHAEATASKLEWRL